MQQLLIEVDAQDQIFFENECLNTGKTFSIFFKELLDKYRKEKDNVEKKEPAKKLHSTRKKN